MHNSFFICKQYITFFVLWELPGCRGCCKDILRYNEKRKILPSCIPVIYLRCYLNSSLKAQPKSPAVLSKPYKHWFTCTQPTLIICTDGESKFPSPLQTTEKKHLLLGIILALPESSCLHTKEESRISCSFSVNLCHWNYTFSLSIFEMKLLRTNKKQSTCPK